jgi:hypothetical protein
MRSRRQAHIKALESIWKVKDAKELRVRYRAQINERKSFKNKRRTVPPASPASPVPSAPAVPLSDFAPPIKIEWMDRYKAYAILKVLPSATREEISDSFRQLALKHHPDRGGNPRTFDGILNAYRTVG